MKKISRNDTENVCRYCGNIMEEEWDEYQRYYDCKCEDVVFNTKLDLKIDELEKTRREPKFHVVEQYFVKKIKEVQ